MPGLSTMQSGRCSRTMRSAISPSAALATHILGTIEISLMPAVDPDHARPRAYCAQAHWYSFQMLQQVVQHILALSACR